MGIGRKASAISGGALALALGGGLPVLNATPAYALDCTGGGLISGVTNTLCSVVGGVTGTVNQVTDTVDHATGGTTAPLSQTVNGTLGAVDGAARTTLDNVGHTVDGTVDSLGGTLGGTAGGTLGKTGQTVGETVGKTTRTVGETVGRTTRGVGETVGEVVPSVAPTAKHLTEGLTGAVRDTCLPLVSGTRCADSREGKAQPGGHVDGTPPRASREGALPVEPYRPRFVPTGHRTEAEGKRVSPDTDGVIPLLWPGQRIPDIMLRNRGETVRPGRSHDPVGTALTAALLLSALLATRVVSARRARAEQRESIPFEGGIQLPSRSGRHRLA
ncbi:hypothetical protein ACFHYQ_15815 [Sphaerimonospora cavernae]|uniref:Uncharacterized protein n=1 Tax=Sphaerimonospora cavernae TaxID=1740611 RepID=A0ABV6U797_9ACTN